MKTEMVSNNPERNLLSRMPKDGLAQSTVNIYSTADSSGFGMPMTPHLRLKIEWGISESWGVRISQSKEKQDAGDPNAGTSPQENSRKLMQC